MQTPSQPIARINRSRHGSRTAKRQPLLQPCLRHTNRTQKHLTQLLRSSIPIQKQPQTRSRLPKKPSNRHNIPSLSTTTQHKRFTLSRPKKRNRHHQIRSLIRVSADNVGTVLPCSSVQSPRNLLHVFLHKLPRQPERNERCYGFHAFSCKIADVHDNGFPSRLPKAHAPWHIRLVHKHIGF